MQRSPAIAVGSYIHQKNKTQECPATVPDTFERGHNIHLGLRIYLLYYYHHYKYYFYYYTVSTLTLETPMPSVRLQEIQ